MVPAGLFTDGAEGGFGKEAGVVGFCCCALGGVGGAFCGGVFGLRGFFGGEGEASKGEGGGEAGEEGFEGGVEALEGFVGFWKLCGRVLCLGSCCGGRGLRGCFGRYRDFL